MNRYHDVNRAVQMLKQKEGFRNHAYDDGVGVTTSGYGFTQNLHREFMKTDRSEAAADAILRREVTKYYDRFSKELPNWDKLNTNQKDFFLVFGHQRPYFHKTKNRTDRSIVQALQDENFNVIPDLLDYGLNQKNIAKGMANRYNDMKALFHGKDVGPQVPMKRVNPYQGIPSGGYSGGYSSGGDYSSQPTSITPPERRPSFLDDLRNVDFQDLVQAQKSANSGVFKINPGIIKDVDTSLPDVNMFNAGGKLGFADKALGVAGIGLNAINSGISAAQINDTSGIEEQIKLNSNPGINPTDNKALLDSWANHNNMKHVTYNQVRGNNGGIGSLFQGAIGGASAGLAFGGIGAAIGGGIGLLASGIGSIFGNNKARREMRRINSSIDQANNQARVNFMSAADGLESSLDSGLESNFYAEGGNLTEFNAGGTHEQNPFGGIPQGIGANGNPNLVEEGETRNGDYVFSNRIKATKEDLEKFGLSGKFADKSIADISKVLSKESKERPNDPISQRGYEDAMGKLTMLQDFYKQGSAIQQEQAMQNNIYSQGGYLGLDSWGINRLRNNTPPVYESNNLDTPYTTNSGQPLGVAPQPLQAVAPTNSINNAFQQYASSLGINSLPSVRIGLEGSKPAPMNTVDRSTPLGLGNTITPRVGLDQIPDYRKVGHIDTSVSDGSSKLGLHHLRYAPLVGSAIGVLSDLFGGNKPDYSIANSLDEFKPNNTPYTPEYITERLDYTPLDREYHANKLLAKSNATDRHIINTSAGNSATAHAGLLANAYNSQQSLGDLYRKAEEYNDQQAERVAGFNRQTSMHNSQLALQAEQMSRANQELGLRFAMAKAQMMQAERDKYQASRSANLTNLFDNLGMVGREEFARTMVNSNPALYYEILRNGASGYKGRQ